MASTTTNSPPTPRASSSATTPRTRVAQVQQLAERAMLVPFGAGLLTQENLVASARDFTAKYRTRTQFERQLRQRRDTLGRSVRANRDRLEREVGSLRRDLEKQPGLVSARVQRLVTNAQGLIG